MAPPQRKAFDEAIVWAATGSNKPLTVPTVKLRRGVASGFRERMMGLEPTTLCWQAIPTVTRFRRVPPSAA
jgi:hypothetical protein